MKASAYEHTRCSRYMRRADGLRTFDSLIAATAMENGFTLVTKNRKHFAMIADLQLRVPDY
jgi:predicted nucleic acid-binding protein